MIRTKPAKTEPQNPNQPKQQVCQHYCEPNTHRCAQSPALKQHVVRPVCGNSCQWLFCIRIRSPSRLRSERLHLRLIISLATVSFLLLSSGRPRSSWMALGQEIAEVNSGSQQQQSADDDELGKTLERPGEEETRGGSVLLQTKPTQTNEHDELDGRDREHSMSIWLPDEHHRLTSEEDLDQFAIQKQKQHDDEEMAGASELNHHFISVLNNQSNIVFSNPIGDLSVNTSGNQNKQQLGAAHHQPQPFATTFLLGSDKSNDTRQAVLSVNWKQTSADDSSKHPSQYEHHQQNLSGPQSEPNSTAQHLSMGDSISNKSDQQQSTPPQGKQESRRKKRRKKPNKKINIEAESRQLSSMVSLHPQSASAVTQPSPARMISYRPKGLTEVVGQMLRLSALANNSRQATDQESQLRLATQLAPGKQVAAASQIKESLATLGSSTSGRLIMPGGRLPQQPQQQQQQQQPDLMTQMSYLDASTTSTTPSTQTTSASPFEFKKLVKSGDKQLSDFLMASGSHAANEFETTLKQQPQHQQEPIVTHSDTGSSAVLDAHGGLESTSSSSILTPSDLSDDDDDGDSDPFEMPTGSGKGDPSSSNRDRDEPDEPTRGEKQPAKQQLRPKQNGPQGYKGAPEAAQPQSSSGGGAPLAREPEHELLVGPFKSESEAPATITLSGVVYQKSGSTSSYLESREPEGAQQQQQQDKLSASGSNSLSGTKLSFGANPTSGDLQRVKAEQQIRSQPVGELQADKYSTPTGWLASQPAPGQLAASINDILLNLVKGNHEHQLTISHGGQLDPATSSVLSQLGEQPSGVAGGVGGLRLAAFGPLSSASSLLSNSIMSGSHFPGSQQLDELLLGVNSAPKLLAANHLKGGSSKDFSGLDLSGLGSAGAGSIESASSLTPEQVWAAKKGGEKYYMGGGSLSAAASDGHHHHHSKHKDKGPIVIVQKDVKPVKYHLMRAYLKLRRLLRPFEATYVFLNDSQTNGYSVKRRHRRSGGRPPPPPRHQGDRSQLAAQQSSGGQPMPMPMPNSVSSS